MCWARDGGVVAKLHVQDEQDLTSFPAAVEFDEENPIQKFKVTFC